MIKISSEPQGSTLLMRRIRAGNVPARTKSVNAPRQIDRVIGEPERDLVVREIGVFDFLAKNDIVIAVIASERGGPVRTHGELPYLEFLGGDALVVRLNDRDFIEQPIGAAGLSDVLCAVGVKDLAVDRVPVPMLNVAG
jgi:hypothetical protein